MTLTVTRTRTIRERLPHGDRVTTTREQVPLTVPRDWAMYTAAGNRALANKAATLLRKVEKLVAEGRATHDRVCAALIAYIGSWERTKHSEAGDTAVRECVAAFHDDVYAAVFGHRPDYELWESNRDAAWQRRQKRSA